MDATDFSAVSTGAHELGVVHRGRALEVAVEEQALSFADDGEAMLRANLLPMERQGPTDVEDPAFRALDAELYFYSRVFGFTLAEDIEPVEIANL